MSMYFSTSRSRTHLRTFHRVVRIFRTAQWSVFIPPITPRHRYPALRGNLMATTATTTSRVTYPVTTLAKIKAKREALHQAFLENATKDLYIARQAETSRRGISFHVNYMWA